MFQFRLAIRADLDELQDNVEKLGVDFKDLMVEMREIKRLLRIAGANKPGDLIHSFLSSIIIYKPL